MHTMSKSSITIDKDESDLLPSVHPGEILKEEFLVPLDITAYRLAKDIGVQQTRISEIIRGERSVTPDTAVRLGKYFGTTAKLWLNLQSQYDLEQINRKRSRSISKIRPLVRRIRDSSHA